METLVKEINIAPTSDNGHFVIASENVIDLDQVNETFYSVGKSEMRTKNHTTLIQEKSCLITCQEVFNPLEQIFQKSKD